VESTVDALEALLNKALLVNTNELAILLDFNKHNQLAVPSANATKPLIGAAFTLETNEPNRQWETPLQSIAASPEALFRHLYRLPTSLYLLQSLLPDLDNSIPFNKLIGA
jgi:hypothetical protein